MAGIQPVPSASRSASLAMSAFLSFDSGNYDLSYQGNNLTITKALLNVIADAKTKVYGDADPSLTYQVSGLKNGDTAGAVLNGGSLSRVAGENVGVYGIK